MNNKKLKINIGGGYKRYDNFLNLDRDANTKPDFIIDLEKDIFPFEDNTITEVKAYHILEHIGQGFFHLIQELYRICENGAIIDIIVPHHYHEIFLADPTHQRPILVETMRLFSKKYNQHHIDTHGSSSGLGIYYNVDFEIVDFNFIPDASYTDILNELQSVLSNPSMDDNSKSMAQKELVRLGRESLNVFQETHMKLVVIK